MARYSTYRYPLIVIVSLTLGGCGGLLTRSQYTRPDVSVPQQWQAETVSGSSIATKEQWWRDFNDPSLSELIERALTTNNDLAAATIKVKRAQLSAKLTNTNLVQARFNYLIARAQLEALAGRSL